MPSRSYAQSAGPRRPRPVVEPWPVTGYLAGGGTIRKTQSPWLVTGPNCTVRTIHSFTTGRYCVR